MIQKFKIHGGIERKMIKLKIGMQLDSAEWEREKSNTNKKNAKKLSKKDFKYIKNKLFFPGWMGMRRPRFLSERNGEPSSLYRTVLEECNGWLCALGINGLVYRIGRMLA